MGVPPTTRFCGTCTSGMLFFPFLLCALLVALQDVYSGMRMTLTSIGSTNFESDAPLLASDNVAAAIEEHPDPVKEPSPWTLKDASLLANNTNNGVKKAPIRRLGDAISGIGHPYPASKEPLPLNLHKHFSFDCGALINVSTYMHPATYGLLHLIHGYDERPNVWNRIGHAKYQGSIEKGIEFLGRTQTCLYYTLERFWVLARELGITRWAAHGGTAMGATCHNSMDPWDDDIDITLGSCETLQNIFSDTKYQNYPQLEGRGWEGRRIDDDFILIRKINPGGCTKKNPECWYKLKSLMEKKKMPSAELSGVDIMCFDESISHPERGPMARSGFRDYLRGDKPLRMVDFGPSKIQLVSEEVVDRYVLDRYKKNSFCDYPFGQTAPAFNTTQTLPARASQIETAVMNWYIPYKTRQELLNLVDKADGNNLTRWAIPNIDEVEIDNTIASPSDCRIGAVSELKVVDFNAERGTYWSEFADLVRTKAELQDPDVIILNEMDIGMARSGNIHTTRKMAFEFGMNYAWGLEFVELTNGNKQEQAETSRQKNLLGLHGNAILSKCKLFDPVIFRDDLDSRYFTNEKFPENANGMEKRLGGRMVLFARTGNTTVDDDGTGKRGHVVVGSVHKVSSGGHRKGIRKYLGFGNTPQGVLKGQRPEEQIGTVTGGDMINYGFCKQSGLWRVDGGIQKKTFPASCKRQSLGGKRGDQFCGNLPVHTEDTSTLPCYPPGEAHSGNQSLAGTIQLSDHSIIAVTLAMP